MFWCPWYVRQKRTEQCQCDSVRYGKQYQYFQQIIAVYESEPDNFARLSELMQEMQETGQPPSEIVKDLAPGLQFDDEGNPVMPNMVQQTDFLCMLTMLVANRLTDLGSVLCVCACRVRACSQEWRGCQACQVSLCIYLNWINSLTTAYDKHTDFKFACLVL